MAKSKRLTTDKPVDEMSMTELAFNCCYIDLENGCATKYRDYFGEHDIRKVARHLMKVYAKEELSSDNDVLDEEMVDYLQYDDIKGFIALHYRNLWAMSELRERLKAYEDLGTVEEIESMNFSSNQLRLVKNIEELKKQLEAYRALGTLDEIKEAVTKQKPKKPYVDTGLFFKVPCKVGDTVFTTTKEFTSKGFPLRVFPCHVREIRIGLYDIYLILKTNINEESYSIWWNDKKVPISEIGKTIFLDYEEAKKALEKKE